MDNFSTLPTMIQHMVNTYNTSHAFNYPDGKGGWERLSSEDFAQQIRRFALGLHALGLKKGDRVAILAASSPWWLIADLGTTSMGGISVPLFPHISSKNFDYEITSAEVDVIVVIGADHWSAMAPFRERFKKVITFRAGDEAQGDNVLTLDQVMQMGDEASRLDPGLYARMREAVHEDDLATIIFTSGSTGMPKGVQLTHRNFVTQSKGCFEVMPIDPRSDRVLSLLPLAHVFERMLMYSYLAQGCPIYFVDDLNQLINYCAEVRPTISAMVPLVLEKLYGRVASAIEEAAVPIRAIGRWALKIAQKPPQTLWDRIRLWVGYRLVYHRIHKALGGNYRGIIVGGAALKKELCEFYWNCGVPLYQGYGLTEAAPVLSTNYPGHNKSGTVGPIFPGVEVKISDTGEIIARGPNIMKGYLKDTKSTHVKLDQEGWLYTGDRGFVDEDGYLTVTGRIKEVMKTSAGKMVTPVPIEHELCHLPLVDMAMIVADDRMFVTALLVPNFEELKKLKKKLKLEHLSHEHFLDSRQVREMVGKLLDNVNQKVNAWEKVKAARFIGRPLSIEKGEMTPTLKVNREKVTQEFKSLIDSMYQ